MKSRDRDTMGGPFVLDARATFCQAAAELSLLIVVSGKGVQLFNKLVPPVTFSCDRCACAHLNHAHCLCSSVSPSTASSNPIRPY